MSDTTGKTTTKKKAVAKRPAAARARPAAQPAAAKAKPAAAAKPPRTSPTKPSTKPAVPAAAAATPSAPAARGDGKSESKNGGKKKVRLVRDSFTMPETTYGIFAAVKARCLNKGLAAKKSEVLRAALASFEKLSDARIVQAIGDLEPIKTGRPPKPAK